MTDKEELTNLLTKFGVEFTEIPNEDGTSTIDCEAGSTKVSGYPGFIATFKFDEAGNFVELGVYE